jgi:HPt (histidine-containing phosphotransfer) domain-containing protein
VQAPEDEGIMAITSNDVVNWTAFQQTRSMIGGDFGRLLSYYREDAAKCIVAVEQAFVARDAVAMVRPAHTLKGDSLQFGGESIGRLAEKIEHAARQCVEDHKAPDDLGADIPRLRPLLLDTLQAFERELAAEAARNARRPGAAATAHGFGRKRA